jgi:hypothetical protein
MRVALVLVAVLVALGVLGCGPAERKGETNTDASEPCVGILCQIENCKPRGLPDTSISGTVFAPNGTLQLYGATVYIPLEDPGPLSDGVSCSRCQKELPGGSAGETLSGVDGKFFLAKIPSGTGVPVIIQIGKWRRKLTLDIAPCTDNPLPADLTSLPKNRAQGDIPRIAISTGMCDALECLLKKLGVDTAEFTNPDAEGSVNLYANGGAAKYLDNSTFPPSRDLWGSGDALKKYDIVLNSCECSQNADTAGNEKTQAMMDNMKHYADLGGRLFLSHYHNVWLDGAAAAGANPLRAPAVWPDIAVCDPVGGIPDGNLAVIDQQANPKGPAFASWIKAVGAAGVGGTVPLTEGKRSCEAIDPQKAERWLYIQDSNELQTFQFTTPNEATLDERCGKVVFSDMHVASGSTSLSGTPFPMGCSAQPMTPQEKALAFMLFDISSCVGEIL